MYITKKNRAISALQASILSFFMAGHAIAQTKSDFTANIGKVGQEAGIKSKETSLPSLIGGIIGQVLGLLGILMVCYTIYAGYLWMTAQGDEKKVSAAKLILRNAAIGLVIILCSSAILNFTLKTICRGTKVSAPSGTASQGIADTTTSDIVDPWEEGLCD